MAINITELDGEGPSGTGQSSRTVDASSAQEGALLLLAVSMQDLQSVASTPAGWTQVGSADPSDSTGGRGYLFSKVAGASEGTVTVSYTGTAYSSVTLLQVTGTDGTIDASEFVATDNDGNLDFSGVSLDVPATVIYIACQADNSSNSGTPPIPSGFAMLVDRVGNRRSGISVATREYTSGTNTGAISVAGYDASGVDADQQTGILISLADDGSGTILSAAMQSNGFDILANSTNTDPANFAVSVGPSGSETARTIQSVRAISATQVRIRIANNQRAVVGDSILISSTSDSASSEAVANGSEQTATTIKHNGIVWTFASAPTVGILATGEPSVTDAVAVNSIAYDGLTNEQQYRIGGSWLNPQAGPDTEQPYSSDAVNYNASLAASFPLSLSEDDCLATSVTLPALLTHATSTAFSLGDSIEEAGRYWRCTVAGTTGGSKPGFSGTSVVDGGVTWSRGGANRGFNGRSVVRKIGILHCAGSTLKSQDTFRCAFTAGATKTYYTQSQVNKSLLPGDAAVSGQADLVVAEDYVRHPWVESGNAVSSTSEYTAEEQMNPYGRDTQFEAGVACQVALSDEAYTDALIDLIVQRGIDYIGMREGGGYWAGFEGWTSGRAILPLLAAALLEVEDTVIPAIRNHVDGPWRGYEISEQCGYVGDEQDVTMEFGGDYFDGNGGTWINPANAPSTYGDSPANGYFPASVRGDWRHTPEYGGRFARDPDQADNDPRWTATSQSYRRCCTAINWNPTTYVIQALGISGVVDAPWFEDYTDRYSLIEAGDDLNFELLRSTHLDSHRGAYSFTAEAIDSSTIELSFNRYATGTDAGWLAGLTCDGGITLSNPTHVGPRTWRFTTSANADGQTLTYTAANGDVTDAGQVALVDQSVPVGSSAPAESPTLSNIESPSLEYTEGDGAVAITTGLTVADADGAIASATIDFESGFVSGQDVLSFTDQSGITGSFNASTGVLSLSGSTTPANYQTALRSITFNNASESPTAGDRVVRFVVSDGTTTSGSQSRTISLTAVNDPPTNSGTLPSDVSVTEDTLSNVDLSSIDFADVDSTGDLTVTLATSTGGQLTLAADGTVTFGGTATSRTVTGTLANLNAYFDVTSNIRYLHGTANITGNGADTISVSINDGTTNVSFGSVSVNISSAAGAVFPPANSVLSGTSYGPTGNDFTGTVVLPSVDEVLTGVSFGAGSGDSGTVVLPSTASQVLIGVAFGPGSSSTGTLVLPSPEVVLDTVVYGTGIAGRYHAPAANEVIDSATFALDDGVSGTVHLPEASEVISTAVFGNGSGTSGTVVLPAIEDVESGVEFGPASALVGTLSGGGASGDVITIEGADATDYFDAKFDALQSRVDLVASQAGWIRGSAYEPPVTISQQEKALSFVSTIDLSNVLTTGDVPAKVGDTITKLISGSTTWNAVGTPKLVEVPGRTLPGIELDGASGFVADTSPLSGDNANGGVFVCGFTRKGDPDSTQMVLGGTSTASTTTNKLLFVTRQLSNARNTGLVGLQTATSLRTFQGSDIAGRQNAKSRVIWEGGGFGDDYVLKTQSGTHAVSGSNDGFWVQAALGGLPREVATIGFSRTSSGDTQFFNGIIDFIGWFDETTNVDLLEHELEVAYPTRSVMLLGDSRFNRDSILSELDQRADGNNYREIATGGHTPTDGLAAYNAAIAAGQKCTDVCVLLGVNRTAVSTSANDTLAELQTLFDAITDENLWICNEIPFALSVTTNSDEVIEQRLLSAALSNEARKRDNAILVDTYGGMEDPDNADQMRADETDDGLHPNATGDIRLTQIISTEGFAAGLNDLSNIAELIQGVATRAEATADKEEVIARGDAAWVTGSGGVGGEVEVDSFSADALAQLSPLKISINSPLDAKGLELVAGVDYKSGTGSPGVPLRVSLADITGISANDSLTFGATLNDGATIQVEGTAVDISGTLYAEFVLDKEDHLSITGGQSGRWGMNHISAEGIATPLKADALLGVLRGHAASEVAS